MTKIKICISTWHFQSAGYLIYTLLFLLIFMIGLLPSGITAADKSGDEVVWEGIYAFYNEDYNESVEILTQARTDYPEHPAVHFVWAVSLWLRANARDGHEIAHKVLQESLTEVMPAYQKLVSKYPDDPEYKLNMAAVQGLRARVALGRKDWLGVVSAGIKGYRGAMAVHRANPDYYDAYLPVGILNYYVGRSSSVVQVLALLFGMEAEEEVGIEQMKLAAEKGEYSWIEAASTLAFIYLWMYDDYEAAFPITRMLRDEFPKSAYYHHLYTETLLSLRWLDEAEASLLVTEKMAADNLPASRQSWQPTLKYQWALLNFHRGNLDEALQLATASIDEFNTELDTPLGYCYLLRGMIHDLKGERRKAVANYHAAVKLDNYTSAVTKAELYLKQPYQH